ncbi:MAG: TfoX/Sxy family protein [Cyclobacteriaceae bacterium]
MAYNEELAFRIRQTFDGFNSSDFSEKKMFGGIAFLYKGKMTVGVVKEDLMVRVLGHKMDECMENPHVRPMDFTKKPMKEFIYVSQEGFETEVQLMNWINLGIEHAKSKAE